MRQMVFWLRNRGSQTFEALADTLGRALVVHHATFEVEDEGLPNDVRRIVISPNPHDTVAEETQPLNTAKSVFTRLGFEVFWQDSRETRPREYGAESAH